MTFDITKYTCSSSLKSAAKNSAIAFLVIEIVDLLFGVVSGTYVIALLFKAAYIASAIFYIMGVNQNKYSYLYQFKIVLIVCIVLVAISLILTIFMSILLGVFFDKQKSTIEKEANVPSGYFDDFQIASITILIFSVVIGIAELVLYIYFFLIVKAYNKTVKQELENANETEQLEGGYTRRMENLN